MSEQGNVVETAYIILYIYIHMYYHVFADIHLFKKSE